MVLTPPCHPSAGHLASLANSCLEPPSSHLRATLEAASGPPHSLPKSPLLPGPARAAPAPAAGKEAHVGQAAAQLTSRRSVSGRYRSFQWSRKTMSTLSTSYFFFSWGMKSWDAPTTTVTWNGTAGPILTDCPAWTLARVSSPVFFGVLER